MSVLDIISKLKKLGINMSVSPSGELDLFIKGDNVLTDDLLLEIKKHKREIILFLNDVKEKANDFNIKNVEKREYYPVSSAQKRMYKWHCINQDSIAYNVTSIIPLNKSVDKIKIEKIFKQLIDRHESFRTSFDLIDNDVIQKIDDSVDFSVEEYSIEKKARPLIKKKFVKSFVLSKAPLLRTCIINVINDSNLLLVDMPHIITDGISKAILEKEFQLLYNDNQLSPLKISYKDFSSWQNCNDMRLKLKDQETFWLNKLKDKILALELPFDFKRPDEKSFEGCTVSFSLNEQETNFLKSFAKENNLTLYMAIMTVYMIMLSKLSRQKNVIVGTAMSGRNYTELETIVGMFINTNVIQYNVEEKETLKSLAKGIKQTILNAFEYQDYPFDILVDKLKIERSSAHDPIFSVTLNMLNEREYKAELFNVNKKEYKHIQGISKYDLSLNAIDYNTQIFLNFEYSTKLFKPERIEKFINYFKHIISQLLDNEKQTIEDIDLISDEEKKSLLYVFNRIDKTQCCENKSIIHMFKKQVYKTPTKNAVYCNSRSVSFKELDLLSDKFTGFLKNKNIQEGEIIGVMMGKSIDTIVTILGILKLNCAFLPLDRNIPERRLSIIIKDSKLSLLITNNKTLKEKPIYNIYENKIIKTIGRSPIKNFEVLPIPDRSLVNYDLYRQYIGQAMVTNSITIQATRGCPYKCLYCHKIWSKKHVYRSAENIFNEVNLYYNMGVRRFSFIDDIFNFNIKNSTRFFEMIIENKLDIHIFFPNGLRGDILTKDYIDLMIKAGVVGFAFALETASPRIQKLISKNVNILKLKENLEYICKCYPHVLVELFTMHGFPTETEEEALMTLDFIKDIKWLHFPYINVLKIYNNTDMHKLALESGISKKDISRSEHLPHHALPYTLPFSDAFTRKYQSVFFNEYFLSKERLIKVLPYQMKVLTENELVQKYNNYLPTKITSFEELLDFLQIKDEINDYSFIEKEKIEVIDVNRKMKEHFSKKDHPKKVAKILLLDLSLYFSNESQDMYDVVEPPLGLIYLATYLNQKFDNKIDCKILKSRVDFDNIGELKNIIVDYKPDIIGCRSLIYYKLFFNEIIKNIRTYYHGILIAGGPYPTSNYEEILKTNNVDLIVLGEGEVTFSEVVTCLLENNFKLPSIEKLKEIPSIVFNSDSSENRFKTHCFEEFSKNVDKISLDDFNFNNLRFKPKDIAYCIYTSGTTGNPKGVLVSNGNLVNYVQNAIKTYYDESECDTPLFTSLSFDLTITSLFIPLLTGNSVVIYEDSEIDNIILDNKANIIKLTPSHLKVLNEKGNIRNVLTNSILRKLIIGGEQLETWLVKDILKKFGNKIEIYNEYGPTEATVGCIVHKYDNVADQDDIVPIGLPFQNTVVYILDEKMRLLPNGLIGELYIGGDGVSHGYLNNIEQTLHFFVSNPFKKGDVIYKTGDLAKVDNKGNIIFYGRIDNQININGCRIELGEIESALRSLDRISDAAVVVKSPSPGSQVICAYYTTEYEINDEDITEELKDVLPQYMLPSNFKELDEIPLTPNGKIDKKLLPDLNKIRENNHVPPRNELESKLVNIWASILGNEKIGINDNFFSLGGDSIKTIQIQARINEEGYKFTIKDIFDNPTISSLSSKLILKDKYIDQGNLKGKVNLTPIHFYFFEKEYDIQHHNQSVMLLSEQYLDENLLYDIFKKLNRHHDGLRTVCKFVNGTYELYIKDVEEIEVSLDVYNIEENEKEEITKYSNLIQRSIDLENGPLMKLGLFHSKNKSYLLIVIHHLIIDTISWRILLDDINIAYNQRCRGENINLPLKSTSFIEWSVNLKEYSQSKELLNEKSYWNSILENNILNLREENTISESNEESLGYLNFTLNEKDTLNLLTRINHAYGTEINDILLCGLGYCIKEVFDKEKFSVLVEGHGREDIFPKVDVSRTIGWFTSVYPVVLDMKYSDTLSTQIKHVKESLHQVPNKGIGYGILKYLTPEYLKKDMQFINYPSIEFNYLGQFDTDIKKVTNFSIVNKYMGDAVSQNRQLQSDLFFSGFVVDKKLTISVNYKRLFYTEKKILLLLEIYKRTLQNLINHCINISTRIQTPSDFTFKDLNIQEVDKLSKKYDIDDIYSLTPMQEGMLFHSIKDPNSSTYFEQLSYRLKGDLSIDLLINSLKKLFKRHDILRTVFIYKEILKPLQVVLKERDCEVFYNDISSLNNNVKEDYIKEFRKKDKDRGFCLDEDVLMRVSLIKLEAKEYELIWSHHHILLDGWSFSIINNEFFKIYNSLLNNKTLNQQPVTLFKEYIKWINKTDKDESLNYWKNYLKDYENKTFITKKLNENTKGSRVCEKLALSKDITIKLNRIVAENNTTYNDFIQTAWAIVLGSYCNNNDVVFGSVVSGRPPEIVGVETMLGLFINTIPVRVQYSSDEIIIDLIKKVSNSNRNSERHHYSSLAEIQSQTLAKNSLIDNIIIFENYPLSEKLISDNIKEGNKELKLSIQDVHVFQQNNYDLSLIVSVVDVLRVDFVYNPNIYSLDMMKRLKEHFENLIISIINSPENKISELQMISDIEKEKLLNHFNDTKSYNPKDKNLVHLLDNQARKDPNRIALVFEDNFLSYQELNDKSSQLANLLMNKYNVEHGEVIGLMMGRSIEMIIGIYGILKAGCAYVPIDSSMPVSRIQYILDNSKIKNLLCQDKPIDTKNSINKIIININDVNNSSKEIVKTELRSTDLACVIYTSGSTGLPKGVMIEHKSLVNIIYGISSEIPLNDKDSLLSLTTISFDIFGLEVFFPLERGARIVISNDKEQLEPKMIISHLLKENTSVLQLTPSKFQMLLIEKDIKKAFKRLKYVLIGGENLNQNLFEELKSLTSAQIFNLYGPTETTIWSTISNITNEQLVTIGKPLNNTQIYLLDETHNLVPHGCIGEICIGGDGLSRGYFNDENLTLSKFIKNPFEKNTRIYKTGDYGRWSSEGNLEFIGRIDSQVKIRGFRVELGEIENVLLRHKCIKECVVIAEYEFGESFIVAYYIKNKEITIKDLRSYLKNMLPKFMMPSFFVEIDHMPLNLNGKINKNELPNFKTSMKKDIVAPKSNIELRLAKLWAEVLNVEVETIGLESDFFELGGHSLKITKLIFKIYKEFEIRISIDSIFKNSLFKELALLILISTLSHYDKKEEYNFEEMRI